MSSHASSTSTSGNRPQQDKPIIKRLLDEKVHQKLPQDGVENKPWEKFIFVFQVAQMCYYVFAISNAQYGAGTLVYYYTIMTVFLLLFRYFQYYQRNHHYFLLDFCYWTQLLVLLYIWVFPNYPTYFLLVYSVAHGPVAWTIPLYRNGFVFHSIDRFTSAYIHFMPMTVLYVIRWFPTEAAAFLPSGHHGTFDVSMEGWDTGTDCVTGEANELVDGAHCGGDDWMTPFLICGPFAVLMFETWQILYTIIVFGFSKHCGGCLSVYHDESKVTLYRYDLNKVKSNPSSSGAFAMLLSCIGEKYSWYVWLFLGFSFTFVTCMVTYAFYRYYWANTAFLLFVCLYGIFNAGNFYIEAFAKVQIKARMKRSALNARLSDIGLLESTLDISESELMPSTEQSLNAEVDREDTV